MVHCQIWSRVYLFYPIIGTFFTLLCAIVWIYGVCYEWWHQAEERVGRLAM